MGLLDFEGATPEENTLMQLSLLSSAFQSLSDLGAGRPQQNPMQGILGMHAGIKKRRAQQNIMGALTPPAPQYVVSGTPYGTRAEAAEAQKRAMGYKVADKRFTDPHEAFRYKETMYRQAPTDSNPDIPVMEDVPDIEERNQQFDPRQALIRAMMDNPDAGYQDVALKAMLEQQRPDKTAEMKNWEYGQSLPEDQRQQFFARAGAGSSPSSVQEWEFFNRLDPQQQARYLEMKRAPQWRDFGGYQAPVMPGAQLGPAVPNTLKPGELPSVQAAQEGAKGQARLGVERQAEAPKALARAESADAKFKNLESAINRAKGHANAFSTGLGAQVLSGVGGTQAYDLAATLDTVKANLGFDELQEMRNNSPTGGALGQVAVQEIQYLQSVLASVQQAQSKEQLVKNLDLILEAKRQSNERIRRAYEQTYQQAPKDNGKSGTLTPEQILNSELQDALARGDTQNVNAILREMKARGFKESGGNSPATPPVRVRKYNPKTGRIE